jgi:hypothetical protein
MGYNETPIVKGSPMTSSSFQEHIKSILKKNPDQVYVTDTFFALFIGEGEEDVLIITGDFKDAGPDVINQKIVDAINAITKM